MFEDRREAGRRLGEALSALDLPEPITFGIPRGGVIVAAEVARAVGGSVDVIVPAKIRAPHQPELGLGAVAWDGSVYLDEETVAVLGVSEEYIAAEIEHRKLEIDRRTRNYRGDRPVPNVTERTAIIVDDGIATGGTAIVAARSVRRLNPAFLVLAVPVAPPPVIPRLEREVDQMICLATPEPFMAVGHWFRKFEQVTDEEVRAALQEGVNT